jgi:hypothetical protein
MLPKRSTDPPRPSRTWSTQVIGFSKGHLWWLCIGGKEHSCYLYLYHLKGTIYLLAKHVKKTESHWEDKFEKNKALLLCKLCFLHSTLCFPFWVFFSPCPKAHLVDKKSFSTQMYEREREREKKGTSIGVHSAQEIAFYSNVLTKRPHNRVHSTYEGVELGKVLGSVETCLVFCFEYGDVQWCNTQKNRPTNVLS